MKTEPFHTNDIAAFLELAAAENWVSDSWELEFLLSEFPQGCFTARADNGEAIGFVTSLHHQRSGWIGNLIVSAECRGRGIAKDLLIRSMNSLRAAGAETVWLTASRAGQALYEKQGFSSIDTIIRWVGTGRQRHISHNTTAEYSSPDSLLNEIDGRAWGDRRAALVAATAAHGELLRQDSGFLVLQPCGDARQFGPFSALDSATAECLLNDALHRIPFGTSLYLDAPASNRAALRLFNRKRMRISGSNQLMYAGVKPVYRPEYLYGLATMGSSG